MTNAQSTLEFLNIAHETCINLTKEIVFDKTNPRHRLIITLYGTIFELTGSIICLMNNKMMIGAPILFRTLLEAYVDFANVIKSYDYYLHIEAGFFIDWIKILKGARNIDDDLLTVYANVSDDKVLELEKSLADNGKKPWDAFTKFQKNNMENEYKSLYRMFCSDTHSTMQALLKRHIKGVDENFSVVFYNDQALQDIPMFAGLTGEYFIKATDQIHNFFQTPNSPSSTITKLREQFDLINNKQLAMLEE